MIPIELFGPFEQDIILFLSSGHGKDGVINFFGATINPVQVILCIQPVFMGLPDLMKQFLMLSGEWVRR
jgi:hypothetical protein